MSDRHTLLLRLDGPMQSWGVDSHFGLRETRAEPSKSGVLGLIAAALGRERDADTSDLAALRFGVRVDREGRLRKDFHTAGAYDPATGYGGYIKADGSPGRKNPVVSTRYYLADACFTVGLEGDDLDLLNHLHRGLLDPHWPLFLGRRAFPPADRIALGVVPLPLLDALCSEIHAPLPARPDESPFRFVLDVDALSEVADAQQALAGPDQPLGSEPRRFLDRPAYMIRRPLIDAG